MGAMAYEMITTTGGRVGSPAISIIPDGRIALNAAAARALAAAGAKAVHILWDASTSKMAMKPTEKGAKNSFAVSLAPNLNSGSIRALKATTHIGWNAKKRETLDAEWNEKEGILEIPLPLQFVPKARAK